MLVLCKMRDAATQNRRRNEHAKLWIVCGIAKWRRWWHAHDWWERHLPRTHAIVFFEEMTRYRHQKHRWQWPGNPSGQSKFRTYRVYLPILRVSRLQGTVGPWLTATAVATDSHCRFSKTWHVADVKIIAGDDQATLMVNRNSPNIAYTFRMLLRDWRQRQLPWTRAVVFRRHDTLLMSKTSPAMMRIDRNSAFTKIYAYKIKQDLSRKTFFLLFGRRHYDSIAHCFFLLSLAMAFVLTYDK